MPFTAFPKFELYASIAVMRCNKPIQKQERATSIDKFSILN